MKKSGNISNTLRTVFRTILIFTLILGILSSVFGIGVVALGKKSTASSDETPDKGDNTPNNTVSDTFKAPTEDYSHLKNEASLKEDVKVLTTEESKEITSSITNIESRESYSYGDYSRITLSGKEHETLNDLSSGDVFFLEGDENSLFGADRFFEVIGTYTRSDETVIEVMEPAFDKVFESVEIASTDYLTEENLVDTYYAPGVSAHFGDIDSEMQGAVSEGNISGTQSTKIPEATPLGAKSNASVSVMNTAMTSAPAVTQTATENTSKHGDLIIDIDVDFSNLNDKSKDKDKDKDKNKPVETSFGIKGQFGVKNIASHLVFDMPSITDIRELYFGLSGEKFKSLHPYGKISAEAEPEATKKEFKFLTVEGLNEKRFLLAVFQFKGSTPVLISHKTFENNRKAVLPSMYLVLYSDWEGKIELELSGDFEAVHSFNNGLRVVKDSKPCLSFENYPYSGGSDINEGDNFKWNINLSLDAKADVTVFGGSVLFYIAGINIGEIGIARLGFEAECDVDGLKFGSGEKTPLIDEEAELYLRGYLKIIEVNVKLKIDGESFLSALEADIEGHFALIDITLFELGKRTDRFFTQTPVSSMTPPTDFTSVITLVSDVSGSMDEKVSTGESKLEASKSAAHMIIDSTAQWYEKYSKNYGISIVQFASDAKTIAVPHIDYEYLKDCVDFMGDGSGTNIKAGLDNGIAQLDSVNSDNKMIILMSDGEQTQGDARDAAEVAKEKGIKIYTIGFGSGADEELLRSIAETTGGEYQFAGTDNIMGIIGSFLFAQQSSDAKVIAQVTDTVGEGETSDKTTFEVDDTSGDLLVTTAWPGSFLDTILVDPNGRVVDENYPGAVTDESKIPSTITVTNPIKGEWSVAVKGVETSYEQEPFYTIVSFMETAGAQINEPMTTLETVAAYCLPIGLFATISSILLLICLGKGKKKERNKH